MENLLIKGAVIIDGTGKAGFSSDVLCRGGRLYVEPSITDDSAVLLDGRGLHLCPGFIDAHSHGDMALENSLSSLSKLSQGITTQLAGQCGYSMFPITEKNCGEMLSSLSTFTEKVPGGFKAFDGFESFMKYAKALPLAVNLAMLSGHVALRSAVMGYENRPASQAELHRMKELLEECLSHGCRGMSTGLIYPPSSFADAGELVYLCQVLQKNGGVYTTHMRNETNHVERSVKETIELAKRTGCHVHISHLKIGGKDNWGRAAEILDMIGKAESGGLCVTADMYPYDASMTHLSAMLPPRYLSGGYGPLMDKLSQQSVRRQMKEEMKNEVDSFENLWVCCGETGENIIVSGCQRTPELNGKSILQISGEWAMDELDTVLSVLQKNEGAVSAIYHSMNGEDIKEFIKSPHVVMGTDGIVKGYTQASHPRAFGTFTKAVKTFCLDSGILPLETMINKMTGRTAEWFQLGEKGRVQNGFDADLVLLDLKELADGSTYENPYTLSRGIKSVIINGQEVFRDGVMVKGNAGKIL